MTFSTSHRFTIALLCLTATACGSYQTVDSSTVPVRTADSSGQDKPVPGKSFQDIFQNYSVTYSTKENRTSATSQFRVRDSLGDTIRFSRPEQVQFEGTSMRKIDGDDVNLAVAALNYLTVLPIFNLFRTGTFYSDSAPGPVDGSFRFADDLGNETTTELILPAATLESPPSTVPVKSESSDSSSFAISVAIPGNDSGVTLNCSLSSSYLDEQNAKKSESTSTEGTLEGGRGRCLFGRDALLPHAKAQGSVELKVDVSASKRLKDEVGRTKETRTSYVIVRALTPL
jgi:hypothetical protein